jgi:predicted nucleic acid-binding protein
MKVFFDTNVYVAEALLGGAAEWMLTATLSARWRVLSSRYVLDGTERVLVDKFGFARRFARLTRERAFRRAKLVVASIGRHHVPGDPADSPVLRAALAAGADLLVTNDTHLLALNPYQGLRIISMTDYFNLLVEEGHIRL